MTGEPNVYAMGDVAGPPWLAHKAMHEGVLVVEKIAGVKGVHPMKTENIPGCTYCRPQVASIGLTEAAKAKEAGETQGRQVPRSSATARRLRWASRKASSRPCSTPRPANCWAPT